MYFNYTIITIFSIIKILNDYLFKINFITNDIPCF
jgi:hypothetical protein